MVEKGWTHPTHLNADGESVLKPKKSWTVEEKTLSKFNSKALSVIWMSLTKHQFKHVQGCSTAKEA